MSTDPERMSEDDFLGSARAAFEQAGRRPVLFLLPPKLGIKRRLRETVRETVVCPQDAPSKDLG